MQMLKLDRTSSLNEWALPACMPDSKQMLYGNLLEFGKEVKYDNKVML